MAGSAPDETEGIGAGSGRPRQPRPLVPVRARLLTSAAINLILGSAGFAGSLLAGLEGDVAATFFVLGATLFTVIALHRTFSEPARLDEAAARAAPPRAERASATQLARSAVIPSAAGLSVLVAISLAFNTSLAALLAGFVAGMGIGTLLVAAYVTFWERGARVRLLQEDAGHPPQLYSRRI